MQWFQNYFLAPAMLGFLGLIPIVVLLYLLKLRRTAVLVPSTMLWMKTLHDLTANAPFQRLRKNLLLLLQVIVLLLLATALARPFLRSEGVRGNSICLLIDHSASMQSVENGVTRLEEAKQAARKMIQDLRGGDRMMVVSFSDKAEVRCELTDNRSRLRAAVEAIAAVSTSTKIRDALLVAHSLKQGSAGSRTVDGPAATGGMELRVIVLSDGRVADLDQVGARALDVTFLQIGEARDNAGIVAFSDRQAPEETGGKQTFALIHNERQEPLETTLSLYFNDTLLAVEQVQVAAEQDGEVVFSHGELGEGILRAELDCQDALAADNTAWLALRPAASVRVLLVSEPDSINGYYLKRALTLESRVALSGVAPAAYADTKDFDLIVFDQFVPAEIPNATVLFLNALPNLPGLEAQGDIENPPVLSKDSEHPVMRFLNPSALRISKAVKVALPAGARTILATEDAPLIADVSREGRQILVVTFNIAESNWPWHLSFPLFLQNVVFWTPRSALAEEQYVASGTPLTLEPSPEIDRVSVKPPGGPPERVELDSSRPTYFGHTQQTGVYEVTRGESIERFAVNLLDKNESTISPAKSLNFGRSEIAAVRGSIKQNKELWRWIVLAAIAVLTLEWWIYSRRAWI